MARKAATWHTRQTAGLPARTGFQPILTFRVSLLALFAIAALPAAAAAGEFVPYRALYDTTLKAAERDSAVVGVAGQIEEEWSEACDGWTMQQRTAIEVAIGGEASVRLLSNVTTWEARNGLTYRFNVRNRSSDADEERIEGVARLAGPGKGGTAHFDHPRTRRVKLPAGTIFPTAHTDVVLAAAKGAPVVVERTVFDGLSGDGLFDVSAVLGRPSPPADRPGRKALAPLAGLTAWPAQIAFYEHGSKAAEPDHEVGLKLYDNGVTDEMVMDFGQFTVLARLKALELQPRPTCRSQTGLGDRPRPHP